MNTCHSSQYIEDSWVHVLIKEYIEMRYMYSNIFSRVKNVYIHNILQYNDWGTSIYSSFNTVQYRTYSKAVLIHLNVLKMLNQIEVRTCTRENSMKSQIAKCTQENSIQWSMEHIIKTLHFNEVRHIYS